MELLLKKSMEDLMSLSLTRLSQTSLNEISKGGVVRLLLAVINENINGFYTALQTNHAQAFLSTATDEFLDAIGYMLACTRKTGETDIDYRDRISKQILSFAAANETSIRLAAMSVEGVKDVVMKPYTMGTGSFNMFILAENPNDTDTLLDSVKLQVDDVVGYGIKFNVETAIYVPVELKIKLIFNNTDTSNQQVIKPKVATVLKNYLNSRSLAEPIIINEITQRVMEVDSSILNYQLYEFKINSKRMMNKDQYCRWNEMFVESPKPDAIVIS